MTTRKYSSRSQQTTLTGAITSGATSMTVVSGTALLGGVTIPAGQTFTLVIDVDTALEEIVDATAVSTNTFTITRAIDGSTAQDHSAGAVVRHMAIGRDYRDANLHAEADASYNDGSGTAHTMHGIAAGEGVVVGTLKTQTLTNKTLTTPTINGATVTGTVTASSATFVSPTISGSPVITGLSSAGMVASSATPKDYVDAILGSATAAATSAASAATSATSAATSASSASTSASSALTSANSASTSATAAATSATSAAASATAAATSATSAAASATAASTSASSAATSASSASTSASSALTSANSASTSASSALTSANSAATSATAAATSATSAAASATAAATSATSAAASATAASTSATSAAASATAAATSASSASTSASSALTSANSASTSASSAATSASSASTSASSALTSANSASTSATSAATSATSAAASAASANAAASAAPEFRQYAAEGSVLNNVPARIAEAETLLKQAVWWIDAAHSSASSQTVKNLGWGGSALDATNGSSTSSDSNDALYLGWDGTNYVYVPGVANNSLSIPDSNALDIVGDIDIRAQIALEDWTPSATVEVVNKYAASGQRSFSFRVNTSGGLTLVWWPDGTNFVSVTSTAAASITDGTIKWIRATLDVDNGASGRDVKFFTSDDGITWTQLGTTATTAGVTSIFASTANVELFAGSGAGGWFAGKCYRAQVLNGIDGVPVLDVDTSVITSGAATSFTALTGQTVTVNRSTSGRKTVCVVNPVWLFGTDDYMEVNNRWLEHADVSENYVYLNGTSGNYLSTPDSNALDVTGDIDVRVRVALDDWTPAAVTTLASKWDSPATYAYIFQVLTDGKLQFAWNNSTTEIVKVSTVAPTVTDGATLWVRVTLDVDNGASGNNVIFYTSTDGTTWTQLGTTVTTAGTTSIRATTSSLVIGGNIDPGATQWAKGRFFRAQVLNGIGGTLVFDADASAITDGTASTFKERSSNAATVTINKSGTGTFASTNNYLYLPGVNSNWASAPDAAPLDITGDIDIRCKVALDDWTPSAISCLVSKLGYNTNQASYSLMVNTNGTLRFEWSADGTNINLVNSTVATGVADGATKWVRATLDVDNGASGRSVQFFLSDDGANWTQLGTTVTAAGVTSIFNSTTNLNIGQTLNTGNSDPARGKFFRAMVLNGIGGTVAFDANFESSITTQLPTTFTESSTNAATVTVNYSGTGYRSAGVLASTYVYPGNPNTFKLSTTDLLNFSASQSMSMVAIVRPWSTQNAFRYYVEKLGAYGFSNDGTNLSTRLVVNSTQLTSSSVLTNGGLATLSGVINRSASNVSFFVNGSQIGSSVSFTSAMTSIEPLRIANTQGFYQDFELVGLAIWRRALTSTEITALNTYFQGRIGG